MATNDQMALEDCAVQFRRNGFVVLDARLTPTELQSFREAADQLLAERPGVVDTRYHDLDHGDDRRFLRLRHEDLPAIDAFIFGARMRTLAPAFTGGAAYLFVEQFVVKGPRTGSSFAWHQDSGYVGFDHRPYVTFWIAIDDATEKNGCIWVLPRDLDREGFVEHHEWDDINKERVGYRGGEPGIPLSCPAGTVLVFSSLTLHRSGPNATGRPRRAFICQYSPEPIVDPATGMPKHFAKPVVG